MRIYTYTNYVINNLLVNMKYNYICKWPTVSFRAGILYAVCFFFFFPLFGEAVCFPPSLPNNLFCSASCIHWQMFPALGIYRVKGNRCKSLKMPPARSSNHTEKKGGEKITAVKTFVPSSGNRNICESQFLHHILAWKGCRRRIWWFRLYVWDHFGNRCYFKCITPVK